MPPELQWPPWVGHVGAEGRQIRSRALDTECHDCRKGEEATRLTTQQYAVLYVARAGVEQDMKHVDLAMMDLEEAIKLDASQTEAYLIRGQIYLSQKKKELAKRDFEKAISLGVPQGDLRDLLLQCK